VGLDDDDDLDLKSEGRFDLAGEKIIQRLKIVSLRSCGEVVVEDDDIVLRC